MCWASRASRPHNTTTQTLGPLLRRGKPGHLFFFFSFSQQCNTNKPAETQPDPAGSRAEGQHQAAPGGARTGSAANPKPTGAECARAPSWPQLCGVGSRQPCYHGHDPLPPFHRPFGEFTAHGNTLARSQIVPVILYQQDTPK